MPGQFIIIDGSSLVHRAFYALPLLTTAAGQYTNAVYGFTAMLLKLLDDIKPDMVAVAFDKGRMTFRNEAFALYKAQRKATPPELSQQFELVRDVLKGLGIAVLEQAGYEGDDIIGTLAARAEEQGYDSIIVTGDRDALQLITDKTRVMLTKKGISEMELMDVAAVRAKYGLTPAQIVDMKGLMGDSSDNIPGVPGVGEKTALKLIGEFGSVENLLASLDKVAGKKLQETLRENAEAALMSKRLATILCQVPLEDEPSTYVVNPDMDAVSKLFVQLEFRSLLARLPQVFGKEAPTSEEKGQAELPVVRQIATLTEARQLLDRAITVGRVGLGAVLADHVPCVTMAGLAVYDGSESWYIPTGSPGWDTALTLLARPDIAKVCHNSKALYNACLHARIQTAGIDFDTLLAAYLLEPIASEYTLPSLSSQYLGRHVEWEEKGHRDSEAYACWSAGTATALYDPLVTLLQDKGLDELFAGIEIPLAEVLACMENNGITVDRETLRFMSEEMAGAITRLLDEIYRSAGEEFNVNSTKQLGVVLFDKLKLPVMKKTKTGYSTDAEVLEKLAGQHAIIDALLSYRMLTKLKSTYLDGMEDLIRTETGRIHTTFNQTVTATGRLSSSEPNLQNIPIRTEAGRRIRKLFVPGSGYDYILSADYSQIELRILAHISGDSGMQEAFIANQDIHTRTAAEVFGVPMGKVTSEMRSRAKAVNFGIVYGISDYGLSRDIGVSRKEAGMYMDSYFARYPGVRSFMEDIVVEARQQGYVTTLFGRRRFLPDINSSNFNLRSFAERTALNTPIQGTAADVIKKAMVEVQHGLEREGLRSRLLLQVHDELVLEVPADELEVVSALVKNAMEQAVILNVPLTADVKAGRNWAEAK